MFGDIRGRKLSKRRLFFGRRARAESVSLHVGCCLSKVLAEVVVVVGDDEVASACRFGFCVVKLAAKGSCVYVDASRLHCVSRP